MTAETGPEVETIRRTSPLVASAVTKETVAAVSAVSPAQGSACGHCQAVTPPASVAAITRKVSVFSIWGSWVCWIDTWAQIGAGARRTSILP